MSIALDEAKTGIEALAGLVSTARTLIEWIHKGPSKGALVAQANRLRDELARLGSIKSLSQLVEAHSALEERQMLENLLVESMESAPDGKRLSRMWSIQVRERVLDMQAVARPLMDGTPWSAEMEAAVRRVDGSLSNHATAFDADQAREEIDRLLRTVQHASSRIGSEVSSAARRLEDVIGCIARIRP